MPDDFLDVLVHKLEKSFLQILTFDSNGKKI